MSRKLEGCKLNPRFFGSINCHNPQIRMSTPRITKKTQRLPKPPIANSYHLQKNQAAKVHHTSPLACFSSFRHLAKLCNSSFIIGLKQILSENDISARILRSTYPEAVEMARATIIEYPQKLHAKLRTSFKKSSSSSMPMDYTLLPISNEDLREYCDKNYHQILPIIAEKLHQEKARQEKLKEVKARLNFEEALRYSESETPSRRRNLKEKLGPRDTESCYQSSRSKETEIAFEKHRHKREYSWKQCRKVKEVQEGTTKVLALKKQKLLPRNIITKESIREEQKQCQKVKEVQEGTESQNQRSKSRNYHQILSIIAEKLHQEKLKAVKARLNFEEASEYSESETPNKRRNLKERLGPSRQNGTLGNANLVPYVQFYTYRKCQEKSLPFHKTLNKYTKKSDFQWTAEAIVAFKEMKQLIAELSMLTEPKEKEELIMYLAAAKKAICAILMTERDGKQVPIYFVSHTLGTVDRGPPPLCPGTLSVRLHPPCTLGRITTKILSIIPEKLHQEKAQQEKLKAVKTCLNFEEASRYSESETPSRRRNLTERLRPRYARTRSGSPEPRRGRSKSPKKKDPERRTVFKRLEKGVFHRLGDKEKNVSAHSKGSERKSYYSSRRDTENIPGKLSPTEKCIKDPVKIHNIKLRDGESTKEFVRRYKLECKDVKGASECMKISGFMHGITNPKLIKRLHDKIPKSMDEIMSVTTSFLRWEVAASNRERKKSFPSWKQEAEQKNAKGQKALTFDQEIKAKPWKRLGKDSKKGRNLRERQTAGNINALGEEDGTEGPIIIEAEIGGYCVHRIYVDGGSSSEILYEHCFSKFCPEIKNQLIPANTPWVRFSREIIWPLGQISLLVKIGDEEHLTFAWMNFMVVRLPSPYNGIIGRPEDLNKACPKDGYPLPEIDWNVESIGGYLYKCFLDAYKGYHQIKMAKEDEEKTTFITSQEILCYSKMPSGLKNAGATYQRLVDKAFQKLIGRNLEVYLDDLVIKIRTEKKVIRDIEETFKTLKEINMKLNPKKCTFGMREGTFLKYKVDADGLRVYPDKVEEVLDLPSLKCLKDVQKLNGKLASLNRFLSKPTEKSLPLFKTLKKCTKKSDFQWTAEAEGAFKKMKKYIAELSMLTAPREKEELIMYLRLAKEAISTVLMTERDGKQVPITSLAVRNGKTAQMEIRTRRARHSVPAKTLVKGKILANFIVEHPKDDTPDTSMEDREEIPDPWILFTNGSSCIDGFGAGLIITNPKGMEFTYALREKATYEKEILAVVEEEGHTWMTLVYEYLTKGILPKEKKKARVVRPGKVNILIVAMDYFTKWIEARPVETITGAQVKNFVWDNIVCRFGLLRELVYDNRKQFRDNPFKDWCEKLMIKAEIDMPTLRTAEVDMVKNNETLGISLDLLEEKREQAAIHDARNKAKIKRYYNARVRSTSFRPGDSIYRSNEASHAKDGVKLGPKWEGPYEFTEALGKGAYMLRDRNGHTLPRTWNIYNLKKCYMHEM
nr:reverse transcriptase domain-containing protein [Tanacetum cinerariifolium]